MPGLLLFLYGLLSKHKMSKGAVGQPEIPAGFWGLVWRFWQLCESHSRDRMPLLSAMSLNQFQQHSRALRIVIRSRAQYISLQMHHEAEKHRTGGIVTNRLLSSSPSRLPPCQCHSRSRKALQLVLHKPYISTTCILRR